ncbi:hypothetical protein [Methylobacterium sp. E-045]|uniref:hypothetical protein n=1 Tax=Methylobacterium sp. E-045 TaxID=2836575 RepID=UPI001FBBF067|nr:hypothetical protein [Methylobacterium sp. E-045]MCJ2132215.1 hypothetical protein [Methylobacterium sp. E-045]
MEQGAFAHSTVVSEGQDVERSATDKAALDDAATKLLTATEQRASTEGTADPIIALIEEGRRLLAVSETLHARPEADTAEGEALAEGERADALRALWDHNNGTLLKTVPLTAAGCRELSRFAVEYSEKNGVSISDDEQAVTSLIARSPLLLRLSFDAIPDPVFSAIERYHAARAAGEAFSKRFEVEGAEALGGWDVASEEDLRLACVWSDLATEVLETAPTTEAGRLALAAFIEMWVDNHGNLDGSPQDGSETVFAEVYPALLKALRASVPTGFEPIAEVRALPPKRATVARPPQPSPAVIPTGGLAEACDWAVRHAAWLNEATIAEGWTNDRLDAEMTKYNLVWDRAVSEPADTIQTLAAKARMLKTSWLDNKCDEERDGLDKLILSVMEDVATLSSQQSESAPLSLEARS